MDAIEIYMGVIALCIPAFIGYLFAREAKKINPESTRRTRRELINGIMGGSIVAIIVLASEIINRTSSYSFVTVCFAIGLIIVLVGAAYRLNVLYLKDESSAEITVAENNNKATIKISDGRTHELKVEKENGKLSINYILNKK